MPFETSPLLGATFAELPREPIFHPINLPYVADEDETEAVCTCANCNAEIEDGDAIDLDGEPHCQDCVHSCEECGHQTADEDEIQSAATNGDYPHRSNRQSPSCLCSDCRFTCDDCNNEFANSINHRENASGNRICGSCSESYYSCDDCECVIHSDDTHPTDDGNRYCRDCYSSHSDETNEDGLHEYSYKPTPTFHRASGERTNRGLMYIGVELEIDHASSRDRGDDIRSAELDESDLFYCKEDGSLDKGFEIVSHPATWQYWQSFKWEFTTDLKAAGYRSYDTTTCGMHVHVSRSALSQLDIFKLLEFFRINQSFITRLSRRRPATLERWSAIDSSGKGDLAKKAKAGNNGRSARYTAINLEPENTVEFRIFRGTLDAKAITRNIALVVALCRFVKAAGCRQLWKDDFIKWLRRDGRAIIGRPDSRELLSWILARCPENESGDGN